MNVNLPTHVVSLGPIQSCVYYYYNQSLHVKTQDDVYLHSYSIPITVGDVKGLSYTGPSICNSDYDEAIFVTFEEDGSNVLIRRWEIDFNQHALRLLKVVSYPKHSYYCFSYKGLTIENFVRSIISPLAIGSDRVYINNTSFIKTGQICILGPSSAGSSLGRIYKASVKEVNSNYIVLDTPTTYDFRSGDSAVFTGDILIASNVGIGGSTIPVIYNIDFTTLSVVDHKSLYQISSVSDISFSNNLVYLASKYNVYTYRTDIKAINSIMYSYQKCDTYQNVYSIISKEGYEFFTTQRAKVTFNNFSCTLSYFSTYGLVNNITLPYPNTVAVSVDEHNNASTVNGRVYVLDQYGRGLFSQRVYITSSDSNASISSSNWYTDSYGMMYFTYTYGDDNVQVITAYVVSTYPDRSGDNVYGTYEFTKYSDSIATQHRFKYFNDMLSNYAIPIFDAIVEVEEFIDEVDRATVCASNVAVFEQPVLSTDNVKCISNTNNYNTLIKCDANINNTGNSYLNQYITAYINGPIQTNTNINTFTFLSYFKPTPFSTKNPRNSVIDFYIFPSSYPLDISTFSVKIKEVNSQIGIDSGWVDITTYGTITLISVGGRYAIKFVYTKPDNYHYGSTVFCVLQVYDQAAVPNRYYFECYFNIIEDIDAPITVSASPECDATNVPKNASVCVVIKDEGSGLDVESAKLYVDGIPVYYTVYSLDNGIALVYDNTNGFLPGSTVTYSWKINDKLSNTLYDVCMFHVEPSDAPIITTDNVCGDVVDNRFKFEFDVYDAGSGVKIDSVELILNNKLVDFIGKPVLYRIK